MVNTAIAVSSCGLLLLLATRTTALPTGAPTAACTNLMPQHFGTSPTPCGLNCPFSLTLTAVNGNPPQNPMQYRCGSLHTIRMQTSDPTRSFRGLVVQARQSTPTFSNDTSFVGSFTMAPAGEDWRIWTCATNSATHTNRNDKTAVDLTWQAPGGPSTVNVTLWFSIVQTFTYYHVQLRGLGLAPEPISCATSIATTLPSTTFVPITLPSATSLPTTLPSTTTSSHPTSPSSNPHPTTPNQTTPSVRQQTFQPAQRNGDLRLARRSISSTTYRSGCLEIYINGQWGTVCDDSFGYTDASIACRQLGFSGASRSPVTASFRSSYPCSKCAKQQTVD